MRIQLEDSLMHSLTLGQSFLWNYTIRWRLSKLLNICRQPWCTRFNRIILYITFICLAHLFIEFRKKSQIQMLYSFKKYMPVASLLISYTYVVWEKTSLFSILPSSTHITNTWKDHQLLDTEYWDKNIVKDGHLLCLQHPSYQSTGQIRRSVKKASVLWRTEHALEFINPNRKEQNIDYKHVYWHTWINK